MIGAQSCAALVAMIRAKAFHSDQRGVSTLALAVMALPILGLMGLAMDGVSVYTVQIGMRAALDSAGLAAMHAESAQRESVAEDYFSANALSLEGWVGNSMQLNIQEQEGQLSLTATAHVETAFSRLFGINTIPVQVSSAIQRGSSGRVELALVIDASTSMRGSRINSVKEGANRLIDILFGPEDYPTNVRVSVIPYTSVINIGSSRNGWADGGFADWIFWRGCVQERVNGEQGDAPPGDGKFQIAFALDGCNKTIQPLTNNKNALHGYIAQIFPGLFSSTRGDYGILWGWRSLSPRWRNDWGLQDIADYQLPGVQKIVVMLSDGANDNSHSDAQQSAACSAMKTLGVVIYTIGLELNNTQARQVMLDCASSADHFFESVDQKTLEEAFINIGDQLTTLRVVN